MMTLSFVFAFCASSEPEVTRQEFDTAVGALKAADKKEPEPVLAEEVFADIFQNATKVDRLTMDNIKNLS